MAHHGNETDEALKRLLGIGATDRYPNGRLNDDDQGEIKVAVAADHANQIVRIEFGKPTAWIGMTAEQAQSFAEMLHSKSWELRGIKPV